MLEEVLTNYTETHDAKKAAKREKAILHRRLLHHLNKLIDEEIIKVIKKGNKGEKFFTLNIENGQELIIEKNKRKIIISKPLMPAIPIEGDINRGVVSKFETATWIDRVNAILLEATKFKKVDELEKSIKKSFSCINDSIGINNFESILNKCTENEVLKLYTNIFQLTTDYDKKVSFIIDISKLINKNELLNLVKRYFHNNIDNIDFVFRTTAKELYDKSDFLSRIIKTYLENKAELYIINKDIKLAPIIIGKAGTYTFEDDEWEIYQNEILPRSLGTICTQSTISIDLKRFLEENKNASKFRSFVKNMSVALLEANSLQRRRSEEYFKPIEWLSENPVDLFRFSRNYIRFWNYGWKDPDKDFSQTKALLNSTKELIDRFCIVEENIYKSCGLPIRFRVAFSAAFKKRKNDFFTKGHYNTISVKNTKDIHQDSMHELLIQKEKIGKIFSGGDRLRIHREGDADVDSVLRELNILITTYRIPLICYNFSKIKKDNSKLTSYI